MKCTLTHCLLVFLTCRYREDRWQAIVLSAGSRSWRTSDCCYYW